MKRQFDAACRQYQVKRVQGDGHVAWEDSLKSGLPSVKMLGKTEQQTYTGKNLLDITNGIQTAPDKGILLYYPLKTENKILWNGGVHGVVAGSSIICPVEPGQYRVSFRIAVPYAEQIVRIVAVDDYSEDAVYQNLKILAWAGGNSVEGALVSVTVTVPDEFRYLGFSMQAKEIHSFGITDVMICADTDDTVAFEPYVGGVPSPSPQYPQEVKANNAIVQGRGKNLFDMNKGKFSGSATYEILDGDIRVACNGGSYISANVELPELLAGQTVTVMGDWEASADNTGALRILWMKDGLAISSSDIYVRTSGVADTGVVPAKPENATENTRLCLLLYANTEGTVVAGDSVTYKNVMVCIGDTTGNYEPYFDGGEAISPNLMCAVDGSCQSTYDPQTGEFVNWWWDKLTFDGSEPWGAHRSSENISGFYLSGALPEIMFENACWSNQTAPQTKASINTAGAHLVCGLRDTRFRAYNFGFYDAALKDKGLANWKDHLAKHPLEVWIARNKPEITNIGTQRLTCPNGFGQIIQVEGDIPDCPLEIKYLAHGGNMK